MNKEEEIRRDLLACVDAYKNGTRDRDYIQKQITYYYNNYHYKGGREIIDMLDDIDKSRVRGEIEKRNKEEVEKAKIERREEKFTKKIVQGVSVVAINVVSENDIAPMVQREVNKEIDKLNAEGKRVVDVTTSISAKNLVGMKLHAVLLWESNK